MGYLQQIASVHARQIIDSRGNPTVECAVTLEDGSAGLASVPSGASTGSREAVELRDHVDKLWKGKGVMTAVLGVNREIAHGLVGMDASNIPAIDHAMRVLDATADKRNLGANAILAVSLAASRARLPPPAYLCTNFWAVVISAPCRFPCSTSSTAGCTPPTTWTSRNS